MIIGVGVEWFKLIKEEDNKISEVVIVLVTELSFSINKSINQHSTDIIISQKKQSEYGINILKERMDRLNQKWRKEKRKTNNERNKKKESRKKEKQRNRERGRKNEERQKERHRKKEILWLFTLFKSCGVVCSHWLIISVGVEWFKLIKEDDNKIKYQKLWLWIVILNK